MIKGAVPKSPTNIPLQLWPTESAAAWQAGTPHQTTGIAFPGEKTGVEAELGRQAGEGGFSSQGRRGGGEFGTISLKVPVGKGKGKSRMGTVSSQAWVRGEALGSRVDARASERSGASGGEGSVFVGGGQEAERKEEVEEVEEDLRVRVVKRRKVWDADGVLASVLISAYPHLAGREVRR